MTVCSYGEFSNWNINPSVKYICNPGIFFPSHVVFLALPPWMQNLVLDQKSYGWPHQSVQLGPWQCLRSHTADWSWRIHTYGYRPYLHLFIGRKILCTFRNFQLIFLMHWDFFWFLSRWEKGSSAFVFGWMLFTDRIANGVAMKVIQELKSATE